MQEDVIKARDVSCKVAKMDVNLRVRGGRMYTNTSRRPARSRSRKERARRNRA